jgi:hypothetical protein
LKSRDKIKGVVETLLLEVYVHVDFEGDLFYFKDGGGGGGNGGEGVSEAREYPTLSKAKYARVFWGEGSTYTEWYGEGSTYTKWYTNWRQFGTQVSDASSECPNIRVPMRSIQTVKKRDLAALQPNLWGCADRKMVILYV